MTKLKVRHIYGIDGGDKIRMNGKIWKKIFCFMIVGSFLALSSLSADQTQSDDLTHTVFQLRIWLDSDTDYTLYLPLPVKNGTCSPIINHLEVIKGNAQFEEINTSKGKALKVLGNGSIEIYANEYLNFEKGYALTMLNSSSINPSNGQTENRYWIYFNSSSSVNMTLISVYSEGHRKGDHKYIHDNWAEFTNMTPVNGWQLVDGFEYTEDLIDDSSSSNSSFLPAFTTPLLILATLAVIFLRKRKAGK